MVDTWYFLIFSRNTSKIQISFPPNFNLIFFESTNFSRYQTQNAYCIEHEPITTINEPYMLSIVACNCYSNCNLLGAFCVAHMMLGESRPRIDFRLGTWPEGYRWSVKVPFCSRSRLHPTKIILRPQKYLLQR